MLIYMTIRSTHYKYISSEASGLKYNGKYNVYFAINGGIKIVDGNPKKDLFGNLWWGDKSL